MMKIRARKEVEKTNKKPSKGKGCVISNRNGLSRLGGIR
jgi:hypothetical protein